MDYPCKHCDKAGIERKTLEKCEKPCKQYKCWYECEKELIDILVGGLEQNIPFETKNKQRI